ncbi:MAG TPA: phosphotransferase [Gaiellaceae bacterium]|nr:phosphotransferase [Gaiellaceae bacterium]
MLDPAAERDFLVSVLGAEPTAIERPQSGEWSSVYAIRRGNEELVVRFSRFRDDFEKDRVAAGWSSPALPVPEVLDIGEALGVAYAVSRRAHGEFLETLDEARARAILPRLFAALDAQREIDLFGTTGYGLWTASGGGIQTAWREVVLAVGETVPPGRAAGWRERLESSPTGAGRFDEAHALLRELAEHCPEERHLVHDDLLNRNVLVAGDRLTAVLDWGSSMFGDPLWDLALLVYGQKWFPGSRGIDFVAEAERHYAAIGLTVPHLRERVRCYAVRQGLAGMSYCAWKGEERWDELAWHAARTLAFARGEDARPESA